VCNFRADVVEGKQKIIKKKRDGKKNEDNQEEED